VLAGLLSMALVGATAGATPALADAGGVSPTDSHGLSIIDYVLSFNEGAGVFGVAVTPGVTIPASFALLAFGGFIAMAWMTFSVFKLFIKLDWLTPLVRVAEEISSSISTQFGASFVYYVVGATMLLTVVLFALRNQAGRAWHHIAITLVCIGVGVVIVLPVGEAAHLLKMGRDIAVQTGGAITGQATSDPTVILVDKFVREPTQRWQYGQDLDALGCGAAWDSAITAIKTGSMDVDKIKDVPLSCPGGAVGAQMHAFAMNPSGAVWLGFLYPAFMLVVSILIGIIIIKIGGTAVSAVIHAAMIKPGLIAVGTPAGQSFLARNVIDGFTAAVTTCLLLLTLFVGGALSSLVAQTVPSSEAGMLITVVIIVATIVGARKAGKNMRGWKNSAASTVLPNGAPNAYGPPSKAPENARRMAVETARQVSAKRRNSAVVRAVTSKGAAGGAAEAAADAVAPEVMIPAEALALFAQHVVHASQQHAHQTAVYQSSSGAGGSAWGASGAGNGGGSYGIAGRPQSRGNYRGTPTGGGGAVTAREVAKRSRQRRAQNPQPAPATGGRPAAPAAPLRTSTSRLGVSPSMARTPVAAGARLAAPGPGGAPQQAAPAPGRANAPAPAGAEVVGRTGVPQDMRRSGAVGTARDAARDYRRRRK
jgi:hypothetical protein